MKISISIPISIRSFVAPGPQGKRVCLWGVLLAVVYLGCVVPVHAAQSTILQDLRLGRHKASTRVVFECLGPRPTAVGPLHNATYEITFASLDRADTARSIPELPARSVLTRIQAPSDDKQATFTLHFARKALWVDKVVLADVTDPNRYRLVLDFTPLDQVPNRDMEQEKPSPERISPRKNGEFVQERGTLAQGERVPVRTKVFLDPEAEFKRRQGKADTVFQPPATSIFGLRVGRHPQYTRVVLEARGGRPTTITEVVNGTLSIPFQQVAMQVPEPLVQRKLIAPVRDVRLEAATLSLDVSRGAQLSSGFVLEEPPFAEAYRIVLDLVPPGTSPAEKGR